MNFEEAGFKVVHVLANKNQEEMFLVIPQDKHEHETFGTAIFSPRAMQILTQVESRSFLKRKATMQGKSAPAFDEHLYYEAIAHKIAEKWILKADGGVNEEAAAWIKDFLLAS